MTGSVIDFPTPAQSPSDLSAMALERAQHVLAIRAIDNAFAAAVEERAAALEEICQHVVATGISLPTLPPGVLEEARQIAAELPARIGRLARLASALR